MQVANIPNAGKLISSLRNTGYDSYSAIDDIIDNSIDAGAKNIQVRVRTEGKDIIIGIADDGYGMSMDVLDDALKLGSMHEKDPISDLGKYGMGLVTASISMAKRLEVITRESGGKHLYAVQDLDEIIDKNEFVKEQGEATAAQISEFESYGLSDRGTLVVITKVDRLSDTNISQFANTLAKKVSLVFRKFIDAGIRISINDQVLESEDPLMTAYTDTEIVSDEIYDYSVDGKKKRIRVVMAILPDFNQGISRDLKINTRTQGFYVLRNNRQIAGNQTFDLFTRHNSLNRFRAELSFDSDLDDDMGVRFSKDGVSPTQGLLDFLHRELGGQIKTIDSRLKKAKIADGSKQVSHSESESVIAKRSKLLLVPESRIEKRKPHTKHPGEIPPKEVDKVPDARNRVPRKTKVSPSGIGARFETIHLGKLGPLYDFAQEGKVIVIQWNVDHPFYEKVVLANRGDKNIVSALDYLVFGLTSAELRAANEEIEGVMETMRTEMSSNLRALLS